MTAPSCFAIIASAIAFFLAPLGAAPSARAQPLLPRPTGTPPAAAPVKDSVARSREIPRPLTTLDRVDVPAFWLGVDESGRLKFRTAPSRKPTSDDAGAATRRARLDRGRRRPGRPRGLGLAAGTDLGREHPLSR